ncbi:hypothetical protein ACVIGB_000561 [Bradyrhizobium sp. USDA 4341]
MALHAGKITGTGVAQGWRPRHDDPACKTLAASLIAPTIADWLGDRDGRGEASDTAKSRELATRMLVETADTDEDGFRLACKLQKNFGIEPDAELVAILSKWNEALDLATADLERRKVAELGIEPPFGFAAKAVYTDPEGNRIDGIVFRVADEGDARVAFVADEEPMDEGPDLSVIAVELENVEVTGPAPDRAVSLHPYVMAAVSSHTNAILMDSMEQYADSHIRVFDAALEKIASDQVDAGGEAFAVHMDMAERFSRAFEAAIDSNRFDNAWVAGMLAASTIRRTTMLVGIPPEDVASIHGMIAEVADCLEAPELKPARTRNSTLLH